MLVESTRYIYLVDLVAWETNCETFTDKYAALLMQFWLLLFFVYCKASVSLTIFKDIQLWHLLSFLAESNSHH